MIALPASDMRISRLRNCGFRNIHISLLVRFRKYWVQRNFFSDVNFLSPPPPPQHTPPPPPTTPPKQRHTQHTHQARSSHHSCTSSCMSAFPARIADSGKGSWTTWMLLPLRGLLKLPRLYPLPLAADMAA